MKTKDMTIGSPMTNIVAFSIPILLGNLFQQFYSMTDTMIVGRYLGEDSLAAVGSTGSIVFLVIGFATGLTQGFGVMVSHAFGAKNFDRLKHLVALSLILTVIFSLIATVPAVALSRNLLIWMQTPENVLDIANSYIRVMCCGIILTMAYNVASGILRAIGDSKTPLYFLIISSILNIFLDIFLIVVVKLGVAGAAYATIISQGISASLCFMYMFWKFEILRTRRSDFYLDKENTLQMMSIGIPMAINHSVTAMGIAILQSGVNRFGSTVMAAYTAASKVEILIQQVMMALGSAMSTYCGQNLGAGKYKRIYKGMHYALLIAASIGLIGTLYYFTCSRFVISLFVKKPSEELYTYALQYLLTSVWFLVPLSFIFLCRSALVGLNKGFLPMVGGVVELVCRFFAITLLLEPLGYWCIRLTNPITWIFTSVMFTASYFRWEYKAKKLYPDL